MGSSRLTRLQQFIAKSGYLAGGFLFIPECALFFPNVSQENYDIGAAFGVIASIFLSIGGLSDMLSFFKQDKMHKLILICFLLGGLLFLTASVLFLPVIDDPNSGTWVFRVGSVIYLCGSFSSIYCLYRPKQKKEKTKSIDKLKQEEEETKKITKKHEKTDEDKRNEKIIRRVWVTSYICYICSSSCFLIGGILSQLSMDGMAFSWFLGAVFSTCGATISVIQTYVKVEKLLA